MHKYVEIISEKILKFICKYCKVINVHKLFIITKEQVYRKESINK